MEVISKFSKKSLMFLCTALVMGGQARAIDLSSWPRRLSSACGKIRSCWSMLSTDTKKDVGTFALGIPFGYLGGRCLTRTFPKFFSIPILRMTPLGLGFLGGFGTFSLKKYFQWRVDIDQRLETLERDQKRFAKESKQRDEEHDKKMQEGLAYTDEQIAEVKKIALSNGERLEGIGNDVNNLKRQFNLFGHLLEKMNGSQSQVLKHQEEMANIITMMHKGKGGFFRGLANSFKKSDDL